MFSYSLSNLQFLHHNVHVSTQLYDHTQHPHSHTSTPIPPMYSILPTNDNMTSYKLPPDIVLLLILHVWYCRMKIRRSN